MSAARETQNSLLGNGCIDGSAHLVRARDLLFDLVHLGWRGLLAGGPADGHRSRGEVFQTVFRIVLVPLDLGSRSSHGFGSLPH